MRLRNAAVALFIIGVATLLHAQTSLRKIGELELQVQGISATVQPANPTIPKNTAAGVRIVVTSPSGTLSSADVAKFLGGSFEVHGELSGPGLNGTITLPFIDPNGGTAPITDPLLLPIPALTTAGNYTLSNLRITVNGSPALDVSPSTIPVKVIDQILITSVETRPLTLDEIKAAGVVLDSNDFLGFQFTIGLALESDVASITFPVVFNRQGVPIPPLITPPPAPSRVPVPTIVPVLLGLIGPDGNALSANQIVLPDGTPAPVKIPSVLVIPGDVGFLKQFFSAQLFVANGAPGGSGLVVHDVTGTINLPPGADGVFGTADDPLTLPNLKGAPQPSTKPVRGVGPDGQPGTADDTNILNPGDQGQSEFILEGQQEGFHQISFNIQGTLDGLATGPVTVTGLAQGGVLVRNPFFDMTFAVPGVVRNGEQFNVYITVKNISQAIANDVKVTIDSAQLSGAVLLSDPSQTVNTIAAGGATTLKYQFKSLRTGQVVASYLHLDTTDGTTGELKFTLGVGERGIPLSPDTLVLPSSIQNLPQSVVDAAMLVLGEGWSIANAPAGTLPSGVIPTNKSVVTRKALALAEAGLRVGLGQPVGDAVRDLLDDFYGGSPLDPGFDQLLRSTDAGRNLERAIGAVLAQPVSDAGGALTYQQQLSQIYASGPDSISFALSSGASAAPVTFTFTDGIGNVGGNIGSNADISGGVPGFGQVPLGNTDASPLLALETTPTSSPYTLRLIGTGSGTMDVAVTMPHGDGNAIRGQISGIAVSAGSKARIVMDFSQPDHLVLEEDTNNDGTFATQVPLSTTIITPLGPKFLSANVIGPETLPGASALGVQMALLFDRVVDGNSAQQVANYQIPSNAVQQALSQLSGRIVLANLQQPEGKIVPATVSVSGIADTRGVVGPGGTAPIGSTIQDPGAVVSGRVFNGDGTPVSTAVVTYSTVPPADCATEQNNGPVGVSAIPVNGDGRYQIRYVHQDQCGLPFQISTTDPNTGGQRQVSSFVRFNGQQIILDIAIFGRGSVSGTIKDLVGNVVPGANVVAFSQTDTQIGGQTVSDGRGNYSVSGITVGPVVVQAGKGNSLGHSSGTIPRAGNTATVNVTLDSGSLNVSGRLQVQQNGVTSPVPNWQVIYSIIDHPGLPPTPVGVVNTDANGNFSFTGVPEGNFVISAFLTAHDQGSITGIATANQNLTNQNLTIVIDTVNIGTVNGAVTMPDKSPVAGVLVFSGATGVLTNPDGTYSLPGLHTQPNSLTISAATQDGLRSGSIAVSLTQPGQVVNGANIVLSGLGSAQFTVLDSSGKPVAGQNVALLGGACPFACGCNPQATDGNGIVKFTGLGVGQISAIAVSSSFDVANGTASIASDGSTGFGVLHFAGAGTVTGNVLNPDGTPSFGANLALSSNVFNADSCSLAPGVSQQVATDQSGNFKFTNVKVGRVGVTASQPFFPTQVGAQGAIQGAGQTVNFNLKLVNTISGVLSGTVFLPDGVTPAGAGVQVTANGVLPDVTVNTDTNGHFAFAKIFPEGGYTLTASDPVSGGVIRDSIFLRAGQDVVHDLRLKGKGTVIVQVVDGSNVPVDNAAVTLTESDFPNHVEQDSVTPGNQGTITFQQVFEGPFSVQASDVFGRGGRSSSVLTGPGATVNVVVQLTSTGTVQGHFLMPDRTTPIPFGTVRLFAGGRQLGQVTTQGSGDPGSYSFTFVPAGPVSLDAQDPVTARTGAAAGNITTDGQVLTLDVVAQGLGTVTGLVTSNGTQQPGANVDIFSGSYHATTVSDSTGTYLISGVPEGHIVANASLQNGFLSGSASGTLSGDGTQLNLNVPLRGSGALSGQVVQADGVTPATASLVTVQVGGQGGGTLTVSTDANGNFSFPIVPAGTANITVNVLGSIDEAQSSVEVLSGSTVQTTIRLNGIGSISGHTLDSSGNPVQGHITISGTGAFPYSYTLDSSTDGSFSLPTVLAGTFTASLSVQSGGFTLFGSTSASVLPSKNTDVNIQVQPSGTVTGTVLRSDGVTPAPGANVTLTLTRGGSVVVQAQTDGTFSAQGVPLGAFTLRVNDPTSTGQALETGLSVATNGQLVALGNIVLNDTPMAVVSIDPADGATGVPINQSIKIAFTDPLQSASGISITANGNGLFLPNTLSTDQKMVTFTGTLPDNSSITVTVSTAVSDIFGRNPSQTTTATFQTVDLTPPHVVSVIPASGTIQVPSSATFTVNFNEDLATNSNLTNLIVVNGPSGQIAGATVFATPSQAVFTPAAPLPINGSFTVTVNGETDPPGNVQTVPFISTFLTVDTIPPVLQLQSPANGGFTNSAQPLISVGVTDNLSGVNAASSTLSIDGQAVTPQRSASQILFTPATPLSQGAHTLAASAADNAGNVGNFSSTFTIDSVPPTAAQIASLTSGQVVAGTIQLSATATDAGSGVARIDVLVDGSVILSLTPPGFQTSFNTLSLSEGPHTFSARAIDVAGNIGPVGAGIQVFVENRPLTVSVTSPAPNSFFRGSVTVVASVSEVVQQVQFTLGSQTITVTQPPYQATLSLASVPDGQQIITVNATGFGTQTASTTVAIHVKQTPPPAPNPALINAEPPSSGSSLVHGSATSVEAGDQVQITNTNSSVVVTTNAAADGSFSTTIAAAAGDVLSLVSIDVVGNHSAATSVTVRHTASLPPVASIQPGNGSTNVPVNSVVVVRFAAPVQSTSVVNGTVTLFQGSTSVSGAVSLSNDDLSVTFTPAQPLVGLTAYTAEVQDAASNSTVVLFQSSFTTAQVRDTTPPTVLRVSPDNGAGSVPLNAPYVVQFSKPMNPATFNTGDFSIQDTTSGQFLNGIIQVDSSGAVASFVPQLLWPAGHSFNVFLNESNSNITDTAGNALGGRVFNFHTSFVSDNTPPHLLQVSPVNQATAVPTNAVVDVLFSKTVDTVSAQSGVQVSTGGQLVSGVVAFSNGNQRMTFTPNPALLPNTTYTVTITSAVTDVAGNALDNPGSSIFQTGAASFTSRPSVILVDPANGAGGVETNALIRVQFSERIDPVSVNNGTLQVWPNNTGVPIAGTAMAGADGLSATFTVAGGLLPGTGYTVRVNDSGITDLAGNGINFFQSNFTTGQTADNNPPAGVISVSPQNGAAGIPLNAHIAVQFSEAMSAVSMESNPVVVTAAGGGVVAGTVSISGDHTVMVFTPGSPLSANASYTVSVSGVADVSGNVAPAFSSSFSTGTAGVTTRPSVVSVSPANGATGVPTITQVQLQFNAPIDASTVNSATVQLLINNSILVSGSYTVNGAVVTFTPNQALPGGTFMVVNAFNLTDVAGNVVNFFQSTFTTAATGPDTTAPVVVAVTPRDGATGIGLNASVVLTFSKPLSGSTVNTNTFALFANGTRLPLGTSLSSDGQTVVLSGSTLPGSSVVTVVAARDVTDLAGNHLADFRSTFTTAASFDTTHPSVAGQRPGNGASGVGLNSTIVLYLNEAMNVGTLAGALHVVQNGVVVNGTVQVRDSGETVEFVPSSAWQTNALVEVNLDSTAQDADGASLNNYQGTFRTAVDPSTQATAVVGESPGNGTSGVPLNVVVSVQASRALNFGTINGSSFAVQDTTTGQFIGGQTYTQSADGTTVNLVLASPLVAGHNHVVFFSIFASVKDVAGNNLGGLEFSFSTGTAAVTTAPQVVLVEPPDGAVNVAVNANVRVRFSTPVNPLTVNGSTIGVSAGAQAQAAQTIFLSNNNQDAVVVLHEPLPDNTQMAVTVSGVQDLAGNVVVGQTTHFTTGTGPDVAAPIVVSELPFNAETGVPLNAVISIGFNKAVDFGSVNGNTLALQDNNTGQFLGGTYTASADNRTVTMAPSAPLAAGHHFTVYISEFATLTDYVGNGVSATAYAFTTSSTTDLTVPQVLENSPRDGLTQAPINSRLTVLFNKPVQGQSVFNGAQSVLTANGVPQAVEVGVFGQEVVYTPVNPLAANTTYTVTIAGIQDVVGNTMTGSVVTSFATGTEAALIRPSVILVDPANGAGGVETNALIRVQFSERVDPVSVNNGTLQVWPNNTGVPIAGTATAAADGLSATFTVAGGLLPGTGYTVRVNDSGITDLAGNGINFFQSNFTTGQTADNNPPAGVISVSPQNGAAGIPLNVHIAVQFSEAMSAVSMESNPVVVTAAGGGVVAGTVSISGDHTVMVFTPGSPLSANASYTVSVSGVADVSGNVAPAFSSSFSTGTASVTTRPSVLSVSPANGATGVPTITQVQLQFNAPIDASTVNGATMQLLINNSTLVSGSYAVNGGVVTFAPNQQLPPNTFMVLDAFNITDVAGNTMNFFQSTFNTGSVSLSVSPNNGALTPGQTEQFAATVVNTSNNAVTWAISPAGAGTIDNTGFYTAPASVPAQPVVTITATSAADSTKTATAVVTLFTPSTFTFRRALTIDHTKVPSDQLSFPVLISGTYSFLATVANGGKVQSPNGYDIIFSSDAAGANKLDHEIESYDPVTGKINFWVRVPNLSSTTDTTIFMQYGSATVTSTQENQAGVWDSNFQAVWHLNGRSTLSASDSTANRHNGTVFGATPTAGEIDGAGNFSGSGQYIEIGNIGPRPVKGTISMWVQAPVLASFPNSFTTGTLGGSACGNGVFRFELNSAGVFGAVTGADNAGCGSNFSGPAFTSSFTANKWHSVIVTWDSSLNTETAYYDGKSAQTISNTFWPSTFNDVKIGVGWDTSRYWNGQVDEIRISGTARSADWISAEFNNQRTPATFYSLGAETAN